MSFDLGPVAVPQLPYLSLPRLLLRREILEPGMLPRITGLDPNVPKCCTIKHDKAPTFVLEADELFVPTDMLRADYTFNGRGYGVRTTMLENFKEARLQTELEMLRREERLFFQLCWAVLYPPLVTQQEMRHSFTPQLNTVAKVDESTLLRFAESFVQLELRGFEPSAILCHPALFWHLALKVDSKHFFVARRGETRKGFVDIPTDTTYRGSFYGVPIYASPRLRVSSVLFFGEPSKLGSMMSRGDAEGATGCIRRRGRNGFWGVEEIGMAFTNIQGLWLTEFKDPELTSLQLPILQFPDLPIGKSHDKELDSWNLEVIPEDLVRRLKPILESMDERRANEEYSGWTAAPDDITGKQFYPILTGDTEYMELDSMLAALHGAPKDPE